MEVPFEKADKKRTWFLLGAALLIGAALRLSFPGDIEYKADETYMFEAGQTVGRTQPWPSLGMPSGVKVVNPGMSVWVFVALSRMIHASNPPELARAVQLLNILGLCALAFFSLRMVPEEERPGWSWATALAAVNPLAVLFERKIWAQSTLPLFCVLFWIAWHYRHKRAGAFFWGLLGICLGQIHMSGFFLAAGVFLWTLWKEPKTRWGSWLAGFILGAVPLFPWLRYLASNPSGNGWSWKNLVWILVPRYWLDWLTDSLGLGLSHSLQSAHFRDFLRYPLVGGTGTYLVALLHALLIAAGLWILVSAGKSGAFRKWTKDVSETGLAVNSVLLASGALMTLSCVAIRRHYLIMSFPLEWVWLSRLALAGSRREEKILAAVWAAQLLLSVMFLFYIHVNHGDPSGDYGVAYQFQNH